MIFFEGRIYGENLIESLSLVSVHQKGKKHFQSLFKFTPERTQSNTWLWEHQHEILRKLSRRMERIIGLKVENQEEIILTSEAYQVSKKITFIFKNAVIKHFH